MQRVLPILAGTAFTVAVCTAAGLLLIRRLRLVVDATEEYLFAFVSGSAVFSFFVFLLCCLRQARLPVFLGGGALLIGAAIWQKPVKFRPDWRLLAPILPLLGVYLANSVAPEVSPDGSGYHLGNVVRMYQAHGFVWDYHSIYSYLSQGIEMLYLVAYSIGGMPAAATFHLSFLCVLAMLIACYGRRFGFPKAGLFAAALVFASPVVGLVGVSAYNDVALATCIFAVFYLLQLHIEQPSDNLLILSGLLGGFCYGIKYPGGIVLPFALLLLRGRGWARVLPAAALMSAPWILRNWFWLGNPFAPFFNRWFPNPFYSAEAEASYLHDLRVVEGFRHWWEVPLDLTIYGARLPGFVGPVFLLCPFALLALAHPQGRRILAAAMMFSIPALLNPGARFLLPALPFVALAMGISMQNSPGVLPALAAFHMLLALPAVMPSYCVDYAWRIREVPVRVALGLEPEGLYLNQYIPDYWLKQTIEQKTSKREKIFSLAGLPEAYIDRRIVIGYESAEGSGILRSLNAASLRAAGFSFAVFNNDLSFPGLTLIEKRNGTGFYRID